MTQPRQAPMPAALRAGRPAPHPARTVRCPHCGAAAGARCTTRSGRVTKTEPCPSRIAAQQAAHAVATDVCPTCQTAPGTPCHNGGRPVDTHPARITAAQEEIA